MCECVLKKASNKQTIDIERKNEKKETILVDAMLSKP